MGFLAVSRVGCQASRIATFSDKYVSIKNWMGPYQRTPKEVARVFLILRFRGPFSGSYWRFLGMLVFKVVILYEIVCVSATTCFGSTKKNLPVI